MQYNVRGHMILLRYFFFFFFFHFHKLVLGTNKVLYLQKQPLVGTLLK